MASIKEKVDPFTGCFISNLPKTVVYLRFALKAASLFADNNPQIGLDFVDLGSERISQALTFIEGEESPLKQQLHKEQDGWDLFYDTLAVLEKAFTDKDKFAIQLKAKVQEIIAQCAIRFKVPFIITFNKGVNVDMGGTACSVPDVVEYIENLKILNQHEIKSNLDILEQGRLKTMVELKSAKKQHI